MSEFFDELKGLLVQPVAAFQEIKEKPIIAALGFFAMVLLMFSVLSSIVDLNSANPIGSTLKSDRTFLTDSPQNFTHNGPRCSYFQVNLPNFGLIG